MTSPEIKQFKMTPDKQKELAVALSVPAMQEALMLIKSASMPTDSYHLPAVTGLHHDSVVSRKYHHILGVHDAIGTLLNMVNPDKMPPQQEEQEPDFMHAIDQELIKTNNQ